MKEIFLIRHAQTEYNKKGIIQGSEVDSEINDTGISQAKLFYEAYKDHNFDKIYVSTLKRTFLTVKCFLDDGVLYEKLSEFNEISWGENQGKSDDIREYKLLTKSWINGDLDDKFYGGESPNEMSLRLHKGINHVLNEKYRKILICIHGRALKLLLSLILDNDLTKMDKYPHSNTGLYVLNYKKGKFELKEKNNNRHLNYQE